MTLAFFFTLNAKRALRDNLRIIQLRKQTKIELSSGTKEWKNIIILDTYQPVDMKCNQKYRIPMVD
jgi:hypothetical protein